MNGCSFSIEIMPYLPFPYPLFELLYRERGIELRFYHPFFIFSAVELGQYVSTLSKSEICFQFNIDSCIIL